MMLDFVLSALNTPTAQSIRTLGYVAAAFSLWVATFSAMHRNSSFRFVSMSIATHMSIVSVWAALLITGVSLSGQVFNSVLSITTGGMLFGLVYALISNDPI